MNIARKTPLMTDAEERLVFVMQLLGDKTRFKIFKLLHSKQEMCVTEIADSLGVSVSAASQHFRSFEMLGIVDKERKGQRICYLLRTDDPLVHTMTKLLEK